MRLEKFRIKNYKSIVDSGDCYFSEKLTILAGKNESGKTSILEALRDFHEDNTIPDEAVPIDNPNNLPEVYVTFSLSASEMNETYKEAKIDDRSAIDPLELTVYKYYGNKRVFLSAESRKILSWENTYADVLESVKKNLTAIGTYVAPPKLGNNQNLATFGTDLKTFRATQTQPEVLKEIDEATSIIDARTAVEENITKFVDSFVSKKLPYFVLFSSFEDGFPDQIAVAELDTNEWAADLEEVSSFRRKDISSSNKQSQANHQKSVNAEFTDKFNKYWTQDPIYLEIQKDGDIIYFWIAEDGVLHKPSQRSQGQQWYLSFFIKVVARINDAGPNVILIDEPGLFLHAKAQKDLLQVLDTNTSTWPIVFSTHSPYLITQDNLENVRLVEKVGRKTAILGKIHAHKTADRETLTPILTAIGLGVNDSITNLGQKDNIVVEGPEDVFYLQAFKQLVAKDDGPKVNFINGGGAGKMGTVGAILEGWGANVYYLFDNDQGFGDGSKDLKSGWKILPELIKKVTSDTNSTVADVLSSDDFKKYVVNDENAKFTSKNSSYIKTKKLEKVLLARQFLQKVRSSTVSLDTESIRKINALFKEIEFI